MVHDMYLFEVKSPRDDYKVPGKIPGDRAFMPLSQSPCPLVRK
jgi:branched-chain amino acid transport system substrate-binding protein